MLSRSLALCSSVLLLCGHAARAQEAFSALPGSEPGRPVRDLSEPGVVSDSTTADRQARPGPSRVGANYSLHLIPTTVPPVIDGILEDACWAEAPVISDFAQVEPEEGGRPSQRTEVRVLYDRDHLYFAIRCFEKNPEQIRASQMQHDGSLGADDSVALIFDTFGRGRSGYLFQTNPAGARVEGLVDASGAVQTNWDTIWRSRSRRDAHGWTAEVAIPFRSLSFDPQATVWGFNVERTIRHRQEVVRWAYPFRNKSISSLADVGELRGLSGMRHGLGVEVKPFLTARYREQRDGRRDSDFELNPSVDVFYHITPAMTAALTLNTDFAETEVDARQVNLTRFPLFLPEKRGFFLEDANLFSFPTYSGPRAFYSRRIGLSPEGKALDILGGVKLAGRAGNLEIGLLDVQVDESDTTPSVNLAVARLSYRVFGESAIGAIFTHGSPTGTSDNWLIGSDLNYRNSHIFGQNLLTWQGWFLKSEEQGISTRQMAFGSSVTYPNEPFWVQAGFSQTDEDFNPGLGFVTRRGVRDYSAYTRYRWRPGGYIRTVDLEVSPYIVTNLDDVIETAALTAPAVTVLNQRGDQLYSGLTFHRENLFEPFEIHPGVVIPPGDYRYERGFVALSSTSARPFSAYGSIGIGDFYNGRSKTYTGGAEWRASSHFFLGVQSQLEEIDLPAGSFDVIVSSARVNITFSPNLSWNSLIQHDNVSDLLGLYSRVRWTIRPGSDLYLVFKKGFDFDDGRFRSRTTEVSTKLGYTFRF